MRATLPDFSVRHSPKAKNLRLKVTREEGLLVVVPKGYDEKNIPPLLRQKRAWIADALERVGETRRFLEPKLSGYLPEAVRLTALGETWAVTYREESGRSGIRLRADSGTLQISGADLNRDAVIRRLKDWLRVKVREHIFPLAEDIASQHGLRLDGLLVKSQRTRWASCSARRNLALNTKLLFLSPDLVRYVLVHELCHTVHMNHGPQFWRLVSAYEPRYRQMDLALRSAWKTVPHWAF